MGFGETCTTLLKGDSRTAMCSSFCSLSFAKHHCTRCKCRSCDFCPLAAPPPPAAPSPPSHVEYQVPSTANATVDGATMVVSAVESATSAAVAATNATATLEDETVASDNLLVTDATNADARTEGLAPELVATSEAVNVSTATPRRGSTSHEVTWPWTWLSSDKNETVTAEEVGGADGIGA